MDPEHASRHLEVIRTLMERAALYRRTLAPVMMLAGSAGTLGALLARHQRWVEGDAFLGFWLVAAAGVVTGSLLIIRRQAMRSGEPFWSPPTRQVGQALLPGLAAGLGWAVCLRLTGDSWSAWSLAALWLTFYGCALHAAGFFMLRGIRLFASGLLLLGILGILLPSGFPGHPAFQDPNFLMGLGFGIAHLAYACYLQFMETRHLFQ